MVREGPSERLKLMGGGAGGEMALEPIQATERHLDFTLNALHYYYYFFFCRTAWLVGF